MTKKVKISDMPEFTLSSYLDNEQVISEYGTAVLEDEDSLCYWPLLVILPNPKAWR